MALPSSWNRFRQSSPRHRANSASSSTSFSHPYAAMSSNPLPVVSSRDPDAAEDDCPVCLEPLSFSFRLPGEKPHIVPECGHALHEACFVAVYGPPPGSRASNLPRKSNLGVCGVCRRPMKVGDGDGGKSNKLAALTGMGERNAPAIYPGRNQPSLRSPSARPRPRHTIPPKTTRSTPRSQQAPPSAPAPAATTRPTPRRPTSSHPASRSSPSSRPSPAPPTPPSPSPASSPSSSPAAAPTTTSPAPSSRPHSAPAPLPPPRPRVPSTTTTPTPHAPHARSDRSDATVTTRATPTPNPPQLHRLPLLPPYAFNATPAPPDTDSPFASITEDLRNRIIDWKGHPLAGLGHLQMFDLLSVRRDSLVREFYVYLFKEAIICVIEEKKRSLGRLLSSAAGPSSAFGDPPMVPQSKGVLRLKGRIYIRHIKQVTETSVAGELSLTIDMEDERLESFILIFKDRSSLETWRAHIADLVSAFHGPPPAPVSRTIADMDEFGVPPRPACRPVRQPPRPGLQPLHHVLLHVTRLPRPPQRRRRERAPAPAHGRKTAPRARRLRRTRPLPRPRNPPHLHRPQQLPPRPPPHAPRPHPRPLPPPPAASQSTAALKHRVIKTALDFVIASLGARDRLSLVTFEVGMGGRVRRTPFLCPGRAQGHLRLGRFVEGIGGEGDGGIGSGAEDEFLVRTAKDEKTDVVTAVNHGLDIVLQRKTRNAMSGMMLVSDAADSTRRAQIDLVLARAEAANVPIHSFGYGRSHDPASLWLMSNHTGGTYTFVKDWYDLRDCLAGCLGGMMSIGLIGMKIHMKIYESTVSVKTAKMKQELDSPGNYRFATVCTATTANYAKQKLQLLLHAVQTK
ncbi:hypothetical protein K439DRAFT_1556429 [Ramaria rubella]|nr:hypothetical protein K439DRAFT_1556429 [Ramaria rubella]